MPGGHARPVLVVRGGRGEARVVVHQPCAQPQAECRFLGRVTEVHHRPPAHDGRARASGSHRRCRGCRPRAGTAGGRRGPGTPMCCRCPPCTWIAVSQTSARRPGAVCLRHGGRRQRLGRGQRVHRPRRVQRDAAGALRGDERVGQHVLDGLERADGGAVLPALGRIGGGEVHRTAHGPHEVGTRQREAEGGPASEVVRRDRTAPPRRSAQRADDGSRTTDGRVRSRPVGAATQLDLCETVALAVGNEEQCARRAARVDRHGGRCHTIDSPGQRGEPGVERDGLDASPGAAPATRRSSAANVGPRNEASASPRPSSSATTAGSTPVAKLPPPVRLRAQLPPARLGDGGVQFAQPLGIADLADRPWGKAVDDLGCRSAQRVLLLGQADVHQSWRAGGTSDGAHWSRSVRRSTFPDGRRGISSTITTCRSCL